MHQAIIGLAPPPRQVNRIDADLGAERISRAEDDHGWQRSTMRPIKSRRH
jgi:hypothetical protein